MISVLYVDDEPALLELTKLMLERSGEFRVTGAGSVDEAFTLLSQQAVDVIVSDYQMPDKDGIDFLKVFRNRPDERPFILFTGRGREEVVIEAINSGADFYLQKGGDPKAQFAELAHKIHQAVRRRQGDLERKKNENRLEAMLQIYRMRDYPLKEITDFSLEEAVKITDSTVGYLAFLSDDESVMTMYSWSKTAMEECTVGNKPIVYPVHSTGLWGEAVRQKRPIITNDYTAPNPLKKGVPEGHVRLLRHMNLPVLDGGKIVIVAGVANKATEYGDDDIRHLTLMMNSLWDIIRRKRAEDTIRESEERFRALVQNASDFITVIGRDGRITYTTPTVERILGYTEQEFIGKTPKELVHPEDWDRIAGKLKLVIENRNRGVPTEFRVLKADGEYVPVETLATNLVGVPGVDGIVITSRPITERRLAEDRLRESEEKYRMLVDSMHDIIYAADIGGNLTYISPQVSRYGFVREDLVSHNIAEFICNEDLPRTLADMEKTVTTGIPTLTQFRVRAPSGRIFWIEDNGIPVRDPKGTIVGFSGILRDITERKQAEQALRESEERYRQLFEAESDAVFLIDNATGTILEANSAASTLYGYTREELLSLRNSDLSAEPGETRSVTQETPIISDTVVTIPLRLHKRKDGTVVPVEITGRFFRWQGRPVHIAAIRDITDRRRAEDRLRASEERYRALFTQSPLGIVQLDRDGTIVMANEKFLDIIGAPEGRMLGFNTLRQIKNQEMLAAIRKSLAGETGYFEGRYTSVTSGRCSVIRMIARPLGSGGIPGAIGIFEDISERRHAEEALAEVNRKLNLLNTITRHDILNQLTALTGYIELAKSRTRDPGLLDNLSKESDVAEKIYRQITFTKEYQEIGIRSPEWQDLRQIIMAGWEGIDYKDLPLQNDIREGTWIYADPMVSRVFFNLFDNTLRHGGPSVSFIRCSTSEREGDLVITCSDDGVGVPAGEKEKIFERGFGNNTGLGLFLGREILSITGIIIRETGAPEKGARFEILVPKGKYRFSPGTGMLTT